MPSYQPVFVVVALLYLSGVFSDVTSGDDVTQTTSGETGETSTVFPSDASISDIQTNTLLITTVGLPDDANDTVDNTSTALPDDKQQPGCQRSYLIENHIDELELLKNLQTYKLAVVLPIALVGNILAFVGNYEKASRSSPHLFMTVLSILDFAALAVRHIQYYLLLAELDIGIVGCQLLRFLSYVCDGLAIWTVVIMTVQRVIVVMIPLKASRMLTVKIAIKSLVVLVVFLLVTSIPRQMASLWMLDPVRLFFLCDVDTNHPAGIPSRWLTRAVIGFVPACTLVVSNFIIMGGISLAKKRQAAMTGGQQKKNLQERQVTIMMLVISGTFVALTTPQMLNDMGFTLRAIFSTCAEFMAHARFVVTAQYLYDLNNSINGYLYCMSSASFRKELSKKMCGFGRRGGRGSSVSGTTRMTAISVVSNGDVKEGMENGSKPA